MLVRAFDANVDSIADLVLFVKNLECNKPTKCACGCWNLVFVLVGDFNDKIASTKV